MEGREDPDRRRRPRAPRRSAARPRAGRLRDRAGRQRRGGPRRGGAERAGRHRARHRPARRRRPGGLPTAARVRKPRARADAHGPRRGRGPDRRPRRRCRRLPRQAVRRRRAARAHSRAPAAERRERRRVRRDLPGAAPGRRAARSERGGELRRADADRVPAARAPDAERRARAPPPPDLRARLGLRLRAGPPRAARVHRLPAPQAGAVGGAAAAPHGARRGLRVAGAMTLRTRIAATAAVAVALVVVIAAIAIYLGVRTELRGEVDDSLRERAAAIGRFAEGRLGAAGRGDPGAGAGHPPADGPRGGDARLPMPPPEPFGGAEGFAQLILPSGHAVRFRGDDEAVPVDARAREIAGRGSGDSLADTTVGGTHLRVLTEALPRGGAIQIARPLDEVDRQLDRVLLVLLVVGAAGVALGGALAAVVARTALAPIARFTGRTEELAGDPDPSHRIEPEGEDELGRLARSFNATLHTLEHAYRRPRAERESLRADIVAELDELTDLVADIVELARGAKPGELVDDVRLDEIVEGVAARVRARAANGVAIDVSA